MTKMKVFVTIVKHRCGINYRFFAVNDNQAFELKKNVNKLSNTQFAVTPVLDLSQSVATYKLHKERGTNKMYIGGGDTRMKPIYMDQPCLTNKVYVNIFDGGKCK